MKQLSQNFNSDMLSRTDHSSLARQNASEAMFEPAVSNLGRLAALLEEVLLVFPNGIDIHDAFRCQALNTAVGGVATSQHCIGEAADIMPRGFENDLPRAMFNLASWGLSEPMRPKFGQLLIENGCIHISLPRQHRDGEVAYWSPANKIVWRQGNGG